MSNPKYYLKINLPSNFNDLDADFIKTDLMAYINSKNQYGDLYGPYDGPKIHKKGITIDKVIYTTNED